MFLNKIELNGFKSFAQKTTIELVPACDSAGNVVSCGVTAIVGPNGSGKSNIADALRWVMGEQSSKNLRGKKSQDVIFSGSHGKGRLNSASVSLFFDNSDKKLPIEFSEVVITRKVYRNGEGEYIINDSKVRLLDVVDLFAEIGIGKESHAVLNQGMSDAILNATPLERKSILEEAAGVKPFQIKRDRSMRKLASTEENLERTRELIAEIEPRLRILKRQAKKAQEREAVEEYLREMQVAFYGSLWHSARQGRETAFEAQEALGREVLILQRKLDSLTENRTKMSTQLQEKTDEQKLEELLSSKRSELSELSRQIAMLEGRIEIEEERAQNQKLYEVIPVDLKFVQNNLAFIRTRYEEILENIQKATSIEEVRDFVNEARTLNKRIAQLYSDCEKPSVQVARDESVIKKEQDEQSQKIESLSKKREVLKKQVKNSELEVEAIKEKINLITQKGKKLNEEFFAIEKKIYDQQRALDELKDRHNEAKIQLARVEVRLEDLEREIETELNEKPEDIGFSNEDASFDIDQRRSEIEKTKNKLSLIGGIDPMVTEEYEETQQRYDFLTSEVHDLESAIESLQDIIQTLDKKIETEFSKAFTEINKEFENFFRIMFDGGKAQLKKVFIEPKQTVQIDEQDVGDESGLGEEEQMRSKKEMGLEIIVQPTRKKIHNLSMLSGGERSLVSLALLFAVISYNPPPFVVLDEVEAALDEHNSRRFSELLHELSQHTQFLIITHNRETMRQASMLYGVTMTHDGITKLLSVRLDQIGAKGQVADIADL